MARDYENEEGVRIAPLGDLKDFEVAEGYPDIRGWRVQSADGTEVGKVHELLVDMDVLRTRYIDVRLTPELAATPHDRDVLVPIGTAHIDDKADTVIVPLPADRVGLLPPYDHGRLTRAHEYEVRRHFSLGEAAAAAATGTATTASTASKQDFYDDERFDDRRFFSTRRSARDVTAAPVDVPRDAHAGETDVRIPVSPEDSVVLKRGQNGHDEIIIRRPTSRDEIRRPADSDERAR